MQRFWFAIAARGGLWTFDEICRSAWPEAFEPGQVMSPSFKRSLRRALKKMVDDRDLLALGSGGPADPFRYCINPSHFKADDSRRDELMKHLQPYGFYWGTDGHLMARHH
jgi:hypothetical protein